MSPDQIEIIKPDDFHLHLRQGEMLQQLAPYSSRAFARAMVMPNISPPVKDSQGLTDYKKDILRASGEDFTPLMTFKLLPGMKAQTVAAMIDAGAIAGKYYPAGATTNAQDALAHWQQCRGALEVMEDKELVLSIHAEDPLAPALEREQAFLPVLDEIRNAFPRLPMVVEHLSSLEGAWWIKQQGENVAATVTLHHLLFTIENIIGGALNPHLFCRPLPKNKEDQLALIDLVLTEHPRVFFGSDSAPHPLERKQSAGGGAAGAFTAPVLLPMLVQFFEDHDCLDKLEGFVSHRGAHFYGLPNNQQKLRLHREKWTVPKIIHNVVPVFAGRELNWQIG
ncbi:MAG: dihydroorotase [Spirochaetaceae bacterium]|jgi:dihydroorotase|nr:dihydroorotase [Spirochaetaceae bacterium]